MIRANPTKALDILIIKKRRMKEEKLICVKNKKKLF